LPQIGLLVPRQLPHRKTTLLESADKRSSAGCVVIRECGYDEDIDGMLGGQTRQITVQKLDLPLGALVPDDPIGQKLHWTFPRHLAYSC
jgi:hypothetical protein